MSQKSFANRIENWPFWNNLTDMLSVGWVDEDRCVNIFDKCQFLGKRQQIKGRASKVSCSSPKVDGKAWRPFSRSVKNAQFHPTRHLSRWVPKLEAERYSTPSIFSAHQHFWHFCSWCFILTSWVSLVLSRPKQSLFQEDRVSKVQNGNFGNVFFSSKMWAQIYAFTFRTRLTKFTEKLRLHLDELSHFSAITTQTVTIPGGLGI